MIFEELLEQFIEEPNEQRCEELVYFIRSHGLSPEESATINAIDPMSTFCDVLNAICFIYENDFSSAHHILDELIAANNDASDLAKVLRAEMLCLGLGEENACPNFHAAIALLETPLKTEKPLAMLLRAEMHRYGQGEEDGIPNFSEAIFYLDRLVAKNDFRATAIRAYMLMFGQGEKERLPDYMLAKSLLEYAVENNNTTAMIYLAFMHTNGLLPEESGAKSQPNFLEAERLLHRAKELGDMHASINLAYMAMEGLNARHEPDYRLANTLLQLPLERRVSFAMVTMAKLQLQAKGKKPSDEDFNHALQYLENAMIQGDRHAHLLYAKMYAFGLCKEKDIVAAESLLEYVIQFGGPHAYTARGRLRLARWMESKSRVDLKSAANDFMTARLYTYAPAIVELGKINLKVATKAEGAISPKPIGYLKQARLQNNSDAILELVKVSFVINNNRLTDESLDWLDLAIALGNFNAILEKATLFFIEGKFSYAVEVMDTIRPEMLNYLRLNQFLTLLSQMRERVGILIACYQLVHFTEDGRYFDVAASLSPHKFNAELATLNIYIEEDRIRRIKDALKFFILEMPNHNEKKSALRRAIDPETRLGQIFWTQQGMLAPDMERGTLCELNDALNAMDQPQFATLSSFWGENINKAVEFELEEIKVSESENAHHESPPDPYDAPKIT